MNNTETPTTTEAEVKYAKFMERYAMRHQIGGTAKAWSEGKKRAEAERAAALASALEVGEAAAILERCPQCDGPMESVIIDGHESWACPKDASAYAKDQDALDDYAD